MTNVLRPTKKQYELLEFVQRFVEENGYGPSYREIMRGCGYKSVATVALHVNSLINRGHLNKKGRSARSLEVVNAKNTASKIQTNQIQPKEEKWLVEKISFKFSDAENGQPKAEELDHLNILVESLKVLGLEQAAQSFKTRLNTLKKNTKTPL